MLGVGGLVLLSILAAGCGSEDDAGQDYCDALTSFEEEAAALRELAAGDPGLAELVEQQQALLAAAADVLAVRDDLDEAIVEAVEQAQGDFAAAVSAVPGDASLSETQDLYLQAAQDYLASIGEVVQNQGCR